VGTNIELIGRKEGGKMGKTKKGEKDKRGKGRKL
jgi:hypothetical protein